MTMSHLDEMTFEERLRAVGCVAAGVIAAFLPWTVLHAVGLQGFLEWLDAAAPIVRWPIELTVWCISIAVVIGMARGTAIFAEQFFPYVVAFVEGLEKLTAKVLAAVVISGPALLAQGVALVTYPLRLLFESAFDKAQVRIGQRLQSWREEQELRRLWTEEFREEFRTFREFKQHFQAGAQEKAEEPAPPKADPFIAACRILGLPENGAFTAAELRKKYLTLMKGVHPDAGGSNALAAEINAACTYIRERNGWL
jgi:hypothetical protein